MKPETQSTLATGRAPRGVRPRWLGYVLFALVCEKIIQHAFVTLAFYSDLGGIRATTAIDPDILMVLGASVTVGFIIALWTLATRRRWAISLVIVLALFDLGGELIAQGRLDIVITLSFAVAAVLLTLALLSRRATQRDASPPSDSGAGGAEARPWGQQTYPANNQKG